MSKLSKFKRSISPQEAAALLSRLIDETVWSEELAVLHHNGWLTATHSCFARLVRLRPMLDPEQHAKQVSAGRYLMEADEDFGLCVGFDLPLDEVEVGRHLAYALRDEKGNYYALYDKETNSYINSIEGSVPLFENALLEPNELYELADQANNNLPVGPAKSRVKRNYSCICPVDLYNFVPGDDRPAIKPVPIEVGQKPEPPSFVLAVAALVEIVTNGDKKNRNQSSLIDEILDTYKLRGLSKSNLEKMFSQANRQLTEARATKE